jgi:hypothetical protein
MVISAPVVQHLSLLQINRIRHALEWHVQTTSSLPVSPTLTVELTRFCWLGSCSSAHSTNNVSSAFRSVIWHAVPVCAACRNRQAALGIPLRPSERQRSKFRFLHHDNHPWNGLQQPLQRPCCSRPKLWRKNLKTATWLEWKTCPRRVKSERASTTTDSCLKCLHSNTGQALPESGHRRKRSVPDSREPNGVAPVPSGWLGPVVRLQIGH